MVIFASMQVRSEVFGGGEVGSKLSEVWLLPWLCRGSSVVQPFSVTITTLCTESFRGRLGMFSLASWLFSCVLLIIKGPELVCSFIVFLLWCCSVGVLSSLW